MQICSCSVRIRNSLTQVVTNKEVTIPEIKVLQHIHGGPEAVQDIRPLRFERDFDHGSERQRLRKRYEKGNGNGDEIRGLIGRLFGSFGALPTTLKAIGYDPKVAANEMRRKAEQAMRDAQALEGAEAAVLEEALTEDEREAIAAMEARERDEPPASVGASPLEDDDDDGERIVGGRGRRFDEDEAAQAEGLV